MSQSDFATLAPRDSSATNAADQSQDEQLAAPSTSNAAGAQPAAPASAFLDQPGASGDFWSARRTAGESAVAERHPSPDGGPEAQPSPAVSADDERFGEQTEIASLAFRYYEEEGRPGGRSQEHWALTGKVVRGRNVVGSEEAHPETSPGLAEHGGVMIHP